MALRFVSYATSPLIVIVYDVTLLLSMTYQFQSRSGKTDCTDLWVIKPTNQVSPSSGFMVPHCFMNCLLQTDSTLTLVRNTGETCVLFLCALLIVFRHDKTAIERPGKSID